PAVAAAAMRRSMALREGRTSARAAEEFLVYNFSTRRYESRSALLRATGTHCYIYVARDSEVLIGTDSQKLISQIRDTFDDVIHPLITSWFGNVALAPELGLPDERIYIHLCDVRDELEDGYVAGYFDSRDLETTAYPPGNFKPVFHMDLSPGTPGDPVDKYNLFYRTLAHEFQHMINFMRHQRLGSKAEERWLEEGLSGFAEYLYTAKADGSGRGLPPDPHLSRFLENPDISLTSNDESEWFDESTLFRHYGASFLFVYYLQEKFGRTPEAAQGFVRSLVDSGATGPGSVEAALARLTPAMTFTEALRHWFAANHLNRPDLRDGFWGYTDKAGRLGEEARGLPISGTLHRYIQGGDAFIGGEGRVRLNAAHYDVLTGSGHVTLRFDADTPAMTPFLLVPGEPGSESWSPVPLDASGAAAVELDFDEHPVAILVPAVATTSATPGATTHAYRFSLAPARVALYPIPHPAFPGEFIIVVSSRDGSPIATPTTMVKFTNLETAVPMTPTDPASRTIYIGNYSVPGTGEGQVVADLPGGSRSSFSFFSLMTRMGTVSRLALRGAELSLSANVEGAGVTLFESEFDGLPAGLTRLSRPYLVILPEAGIGGSRLRITSPAGFAGDVRRLALWAPDALPGSTGAGHWNPVAQSDSGYFSDLRSGGTYLLVADEAAPRILDAHIEETEGTPALQARLADDGSGIDAGTIRVEVDGVVVPHRFDPGTGLMKADLARMAAGHRTIRIEAADLAGNIVQGTVAGNLAGPLRILQALSWPNPSRGPLTIAVMMAGEGSDDPLLEGEARVMDVSGRTVVTLPLSPAGNRTLTARWDGRNDVGTSIANGVYVFRVRIDHRGDRLRATGKIAILR
ncbi:MAG TPA: hypothetical protein VIV61_04835, partial [Candidatus Ozemobacteraceae bacterium]